MSVDLAGAGASTRVAGRGAGAAAGAASSGVSAQDLIATRTDTTTAAQGAGLLEDIESISSSLKEGSWLGVGLSTVGAVADVASAVTNPIATLVSWGAGFLIEHFEPLKGWMDQLAGNADQVRAHAQTWANTATAMGGQADSMESDVSSLLCRSEGQTADAARTRCGKTVDALRGGASSTEGVSTAIGILAEVVGIVRSLVVGAISDIIGQLAQAIAEAVLSVGTLAPLVAAQISTKVSAFTADVSPKINGLIEAGQRLSHSVTDLSGKATSMKAGLAAVVPGFGMMGKRGKIDDLVDHASWVKGRRSRSTPDGVSAVDHLADMNQQRIKFRATRVGLERTVDRMTSPFKSALDKHFPNRNSPRNPRSHMTVKRREDTTSYLREQGVDKETLDDLNDTAADLTAARVAEARSAEKMGHAALEAKWDEMGIIQAGGVGGPGTGRGHVDTIGYRPGELHVGECKGGTSAKIGTYEVDGVKVEQGSAAYVGDRLAKDTDFHQKMRENPALWEAVKDGRVTVYSDVAIARSGNAGKIDFRTEPIELDPAHIARIDQAIKAL